jgi:hypothetical protein
MNLYYFNICEWPSAVHCLTVSNSGFDAKCQSKEHVFFFSCKYFTLIMMYIILFIPSFKAVRRVDFGSFATCTKMM